MARHQRRRGHNLRRRVADRSERRSFVILCEGKETEPQYLSALKQLPEVHEAVSVDIRGPVGRPLQLVEAAIKVQSDNDETNEVWCVFDVEAPQPHPNLKEALALARDKGINTAVSNPCFEIWLALHFDQHNAPLTTDDAVRLRRTHDGSTGKEVTGELYMSLRTDAVHRARDLSTYHVANGTLFPNDNPSSSMFRLLEAIEPNTTK